MDADRRNELRATLRRASIDEARLSDDELERVMRRMLQQADEGDDEPDAPNRTAD